MATETWYQNPETGVEFVFTPPLPPGIPYQIAAGRLERIADPDGSQMSSLPVKEADLTGGEGPDDESEQDEPVLFPCLDCDDVAVKGPDGEFTDHCAKHTPK